MTVQEMSQNLPERFSVSRHPNHLLLAGVNNRNNIITQRFHSVPVHANREFFWPTDCIFQL